MVRSRKSVLRSQLGVALMAASQADDKQANSIPDMTVRDRFDGIERRLKDYAVTMLYRQTNRKAQGRNGLRVRQ